VKFSSSGSSLLEGFSLNGHIVCSKVDIVACINKKEYSTVIKMTEIENASFSRVVVKVSGAVVSSEGEEHLPFDVRLYLYSDASSVKVLHSFVHDLDGTEPLMSLGLRFLVPLEKTELYNRHIRLGGSSGGILKEEVQGLSGLRYGPTIQNKIDQTAGNIVILNSNEWQRIISRQDNHIFLPGTRILSLSCHRTVLLSRNEPKTAVRG
jgi:hypothetical protein